MSNESKRVGVIGLGAMGAPMAEQILRKHGQVTVFDIDPAAAQKLASAGAKVASSPKAVGESSDVVIAMLPHPDVLREVVLGNDGLAEGMKRGNILIDMSTDGIAVVQEMDKALRPK